MLLRDSQTHTFCPWKGTASYYDIIVDGKTNKDAAWTYAETKGAARHVKGYVAFWKGIEVAREEGSCRARDLAKGHLLPMIMSGKHNV